MPPSTIKPVDRQLNPPKRFSIENERSVPEMPILVYNADTGDPLRIQGRKIAVLNKEDHPAPWRRPLGAPQPRIGEAIGFNEPTSLWRVADVLHDYSGPRPVIILYLRKMETDVRKLLP